MRFPHSLAERLMTKSPQRGLSPWERAFLARHLESCARCREFGLNLAEFLHEGEPPLALPRRDAGLLHQGILVALRRAAAAEDALDSGRLLRARRPLVSPTFFPALGAAALILAFLVFLSMPRPSALRVPGGGHEAEFHAPPGQLPQLQPSPLPELSPLADLTASSLSSTTAVGFTETARPEASSPGAASLAGSTATAAPLGDSPTGAAQGVSASSR